MPVAPLTMNRLSSPAGEAMASSVGDGRAGTPRSRRVRDGHRTNRACTSLVGGMHRRVLGLPNSKLLVEPDGLDHVVGDKRVVVERRDTCGKPDYALRYLHEKSTD